ncbi:hypothetical protein [Piscibacillus halophilus]|uniref:hypothetical protein n=1 Tax=Piscibacillus halophilus TaxID=571933 RepID=UPI00158C332E|nr:hypothetical protein [Piscibacillus halophilus]
MKTLFLDQNQLSLIVLITNMMKKPTKKALYKTNGKKEGKSAFSYFKSMNSKINDISKGVSENQLNIEVKLEDEELFMLQQFLIGYLDQVTREQRDKQSQEERINLAILESVLDMANRGLGHAV